MRTLMGVATSTAAMLSRDSSWPEGAGRSRLGPNTVARLLRFILLCSELAAILVCVCVGGWVHVFMCVCVCVIGNIHCTCTCIYMYMYTANVPVPSEVFE